jgi:hypothetical protein
MAIVDPVIYRQATPAGGGDQSAGMSLSLVAQNKLQAWAIAAEIGSYFA